MYRVTMEDLRELLKELNNITRGDEFKYQFYICNGGYGLDKVINAAGGARTVIARTTKKDLYNQMNAYIKGIEMQQEKEREAVNYLYTLKANADEDVAVNKLLSMFIGII